MTPAYTLGMARNTFIFQARKQKGDEGDLRIFIAEGLTDTWIASRRYRIMAPGDIVFFWMAGGEEIRGIYGWGMLISTAEQDERDGTYSVKVRYERRFGTPLLATTLLSHGRLCRLPILRSAAGTNFLVDPELARALARKIRVDGREAPEALLGASGFAFDVALSYAGEDRGYAKKLEELLRAEGLRVYFDAGQPGDLWGKGLTERLASIYTKESRYCVILVSSHYRKKRWCQYECGLLQTLLARDLAHRSRDPAVLPVKLDDTELEGLPEDCAYLDARVMGLKRIAECVGEKVRAQEGR